MSRSSVSDVLSCDLRISTVHIGAVRRGFTRIYAHLLETKSLNLLDLRIFGYVFSGCGIAAQALPHKLQGYADNGKPGSREIHMSTKPAPLGKKAKAALAQSLARLRVEMALPLRFVDDPSAERIRALRRGMELSRQKFADQFGLDFRTLQDWEQGRRVPDRAARVLLAVIEREPGAVVRSLCR